MLQAGDRAPAFALQDMSGKSQNLTEILARGPAVLVLFKISCPVCQMTLPYLDRMGKASLQVIAISQDDANGTARFQRNFGVTLPTLLDREQSGYLASNGFGISHVPSVFMVEQDGTISLASEGFVKRDLEMIGKRSGIEPFGPGDNVPAWKAG